MRLLLITAFRRLGLDYGARPEMALSGCELEWLFELVGSAKATTTLEIGLGFGISAAALLHSGVAKHTAIERYRSDVPTALHNVERVIRSDQRFELINGPSDMVLPALARRRRRFDVVLIDGGHRFDDVFIDVHYATMLLPADGIMVLDDT
jgi:predicted O-methyltransferase YrrM